MRLGRGILSFWRRILDFRRFVTAKLRCVRRGGTSAAKGFLYQISMESSPALHRSNTFLLGEDGRWTSAPESTVSFDGMGPLHITASLGQEDATQILLATGLDVDGKDNIGRTPLHYAALYRSKEVMKLLLAFGADANAGNNYGGTPLHTAASFRMKDIAELLLAYGAEVNSENNFGETPLSCAIEHGHDEVAEILRRHGGLERMPRHEEPRVAPDCLQLPVLAAA